ncbi:P-loop containing nucleoside triphosphate hydrolase protein [Trichodelitschia bisporula]|uniref:RNA helicase n=1 Tax=Trichodelitschia bisporula TaxID=703511 RepID=A0A6G1HMA6_9PEZI|nr:P-loop containing nucleoside triphosphate hydrolase protein [Trichodelitschia bisporula]
MAKFVPRQRKHKARDREQRNAAATAGGDANATEILPASKVQHEERKRKLREELRSQQHKMSSKKQKRLDHYIETKLKKEENLELIKKLEQTKVDTSLFHSAKRLGQQTESKRDILSRALRERRAGINVEQAEATLFVKRPEPVPELESDSEDEKPDPAPQAAAALKSTSGGPAGFGSGLKRPLELDEEGRPVLPRIKRKKTKATPLVFHIPAREESEEELEEEPEWTGFSSESEAEGCVQLRSILKPAKAQLGGEADEESPSEQLEDALSQQSQSESDMDESGMTEGEEDEGDTGSEGSESSDEDSGDQKAEKKARTSAFKAWAEQQRNEALGFQPTSNIEGMTAAAKSIKFTPRPVEQDVLPPELQINANINRKVHAVNVQRPEEIQEARLALPVVAEEQKIMEAIFSNDVVVISGATGSGKTTQVPQFLFENGFGDPNGPTPGMIGVTQPRRVAAVSMAKRVATELASSADRVSYQIRFDTTVNKKTAVKFMTDGVLLREMSEDFSLKKYSVIIIDEAHERTVNTDILISLMSRCVKTRAQLAKEKPKLYTPLKLIIMSATLRVSDFRENSRLFSNPPPLVTAEGRQYEVTPHWSRKTSHDYLEEAYTRVCRGHRKLPPGGMLVFLTGQSEIRALAKRLKQTFQATEPTHEHPPVRISATEMPMESDDLDAERTKPARLELPDEDSGADDSDIEIEGLEDADAEFKIEGEEAGELMKVHVLPLYSQLPSNEQLRVFEPPPDGSRLIVLSTNVAETSLTIPGIRYVFDSGRAKERIWDRAGVQTFRTSWISKASADQRAGRAGRTGPGHCYRLYSSAVYESFTEFSEPEIFRSPLEGVILQLKALNISRIDNFPFPTPPERASLVKAEALLCHLGALDANRRITPLGRELQNYPLNPRFAQMLRLGLNYNCVPQVIAMVAALDVPELFIPESSLDLRTPEREEDAIRTQADNIEESARERRRKDYNTAHGHLASLDRSSDAVKLFSAINKYSNSPDPEDFCNSMFLRSKALNEANSLREQLTSIACSHKPDAIRAYKPLLPTPSDKQINLLKQIVAAGFVDQVAIRADFLPTPPPVDRKPKRAIDMRYQTLIPSWEGTRPGTPEDAFVYPHPSSVLAHMAPYKLPRYIVYHRLQRSQSSAPGKVPKTRMHALTPVSGEQLAVLARGTTLLEVGKPLGKIEVLESQGGVERRQCEVLLSLVGGGGAMGWPLVRKSVVQKRVPGEGWVIEQYL